MARKTVTLRSVLALASAASAHVLLKTPVPYGAATLNTNPLLADGSDYPCKQRPGVYDVTQINSMPISQPQTLSFQGQATHGGGTCQISLTTDTPPTKASVFKVIKTIEGGCPSTNPGNVGTDPFGFGADQFTFAIPNTIPAGRNYTLAWTWFNKIGNREMYMNCAPITVPGSSQRRDLDAQLEERNVMAASMSALPDMFRANIGGESNGCSTAESGTVVAIPAGNTGSNVQRIGGDPLTPPVGSCGGNSYAAPAPAPAPDAPQSVQPVPPPPSQPSTTAASPSPPAPTPTTTSSSTSAPPPPANPSAAAPAPAPAPAAPPAPAGLNTGTCPTPGKSLCSPDGTAWGTCDENHYVIFQKVAIGTKCDLASGVEVPLRRSRAFRL